jgi:putative protein kinase ArgK-like GTPase of G3E family
VGHDAEGRAYPSAREQDRGGDRDGAEGLKAGLLEIADVHVVNKADRDGAHKVVSDLREMLRLARRSPRQWNVPIAQTVAATGDGVPELVDRFDEHRAWMERSGEVAARARRNAASNVTFATRCSCRPFWQCSHSRLAGRRMASPLRMVSPASTSRDWTAGEARRFED